MPRRLLTVPARGWSRLVAYHQGIVLIALTFALVVALGLAVAGWTAARNAEQRVSRLEVAEAAGRAAKEESEKISKVVTCYTAAKSRPLLTTVLRALAGREIDPVARAAFNVLISTYETQPTPGIEGMPTRSKCRALADSLDVDASLYDQGA